GPHRAALQLGAAAPLEPEGAPRLIHDQPILTRAKLVAHGELGEGRGATRIDPEIQAQLANHVVEHDVRLQEVDPCRGLEQLIGADRTPVGRPGLARLDPDGRLSQVARREEARGRQADTARCAPAARPPSRPPCPASPRAGGMMRMLWYACNMRSSARQTCGWFATTPLTGAPTACKCSAS